MNKKKILLYEVVGAIFIIIVGAAFHFIYELSGYNVVVGAISPVNESVWEHLKLAFIPSLIFALFEFILLQNEAKNFAFAKTVSVYLMVSIIPAIFYSYTAFTGDSIFAVDFSSFIFAVIIGQIASYKILTFRVLSRKLVPISLVLFVVLLVMFVAFTFYPPQLDIFLDPVTGGYGISG